MAFGGSASAFVLTKNGDIFQSYLSPIYGKEWCFTVKLFP